ncbi:MAG: glycosyltransferase family 4 protein [Betaproteobacteria bacterium]|nr:glycosyltransferase family 4 protein [Betaproteobacteria bacterium]
MSASLSILHTEASQGWGGQEIRILTEAEGFLARGHRVMIATPREAPIFAAAQQRGIPVAGVDLRKKRLGNLKALRAWLQHEAPVFDVVNTHSSTDAWLVALSGLGGRRVPPVVRTRHVSTPIHANFATRWLYTKATAHVVTTGESLRLQLHRETGMPLERTSSVRTGIDLARFTPLDQAAMRAKLSIPDRPTLGILATMRDWKGHHDLFDAMKLLKDRFPAWQLLVIGGGPAGPELARRVAAERLEDTIRMVGNQDNVPEWLSALDLFVLPSYASEGVPQGIMQAMACALPVVATPVGAIGEAVQDGLTGLMTAPRDPAQLASTLARLMDSAPLRRQMGQAGLAFARAHFGIDIMVDGMESVFRAVSGKLH